MTRKEKALIDLLASGPTAVTEIATKLYGVDFRSASPRLKESIRSRIFKTVSRARSVMHGRNIGISFDARKDQYAFCGVKRL